MSISSSTDIAGLARSYVNADRASMDAYFSSQQSRYQAQLSAYNTISSQLGSFQDMVGGLLDDKTLNAYSVSANNSDVATVTAGTDAVPGSYELYVEQIAANDQYALTFASADDPLPTSGELTLTLGGDKSFTVDMTRFSATSTLSDLRDAINHDSDNPGIRASIIRSGESVMLVLAGEDTGAANTISMATDGSAAMADITDAINNKTQLSTAQDAVIYLGANKALKITADNNELDSVISGLTIDLKTVSSSASDTVKFTVSADTDSTVDKVQKFVDAYNKLVDTIRPYTNNSSTITDDDSGSQRPALSGDSSVRMLLSQMRSLFTESGFYSVGIEGDTSGHLKFDQGKLEQALDDNPDVLDEVFFAGDTSGLNKLDSVIDTYIHGDQSILKARASNVQSNLDRLDDRMDIFDQQMDNLYRRYVSDFTSMQQLVSSMQNSASLFG